MKTGVGYILVLICLMSCVMLPAAEYGGKWGEESIREYSMKYIELTKERFSKRAARLSDMMEYSPTVEYRELTEAQQEGYQKFLQDRLSTKHRDSLCLMMLRDLEEVRVKLAEAEKAAFEVWEKLPKDEKAEKEERAKMIEGEIYGTEVSSSKLGVVLDNSPSMRPYLEAVRAEVIKSFPDAHFREAAESGLHLARGYVSSKSELFDDSWYYGEMPATGVNPFDPKWHQPKIHDKILPYVRQVQLDRNALPALMALINLQQVDVVYWFCDFEDEIDDRALQLLGKALKEHEVKLYVHSSNRRPKKNLTEVIKASGGEVIRKRIR